MKNFQNALYYPHINFQNPHWVKSMAMMYDSIYRIVPTDHSKVDKTTSIFVFFMVLMIFYNNI